MLRLDALRAVYPELASRIVVTNMGAAPAELFSLGHQPGFFYVWHAMGLASSVGLGIALARPELSVVVVDGDGSVLMNLGTLTTLARYRPRNLVHLVTLAEDDPEMVLVRLAKEEEGVGISAGAHLAGVRSAMLLQNHGFLASVNGIVSLAQLYRIPLLLLVSYRGGFGEEHPWQTEGGGVTEAVLAALRVPYLSLDAPEQVAARVREAQTLAEANLRPVALLLCRGLLWEDE